MNEKQVENEFKSTTNYFVPQDFLERLAHLGGGQYHELDNITMLANYFRDQVTTLTRAFTLVQTKN